jgi:endonuclease YncB( thermonuclease family)
VTVVIVSLVVLVAVGLVSVVLLSAGPSPEPLASDQPGATPRSAAALPSVAGIVTRVVDGDTVEVDGLTVRLIGIDTPERDECGFTEASVALQRLVLGQQVRVTAVPGREDRDRYGRLLRYVDAQGLDAGLNLIRQGLAVARYDGRDGYERHPRQAVYVRADARSPDFC